MKSLRYFLLSLFSGLSSLLVAQVTVTGVVVSSDNQLLPYGIVEFDQTTIVQCDDRGYFKIQNVGAGDHSLRIVILGFENLDTTIRISGSESVVDLGQLKMQVRMYQIPEVVIASPQYPFCYKYMGSSSSVGKNELNRTQPMGSEEVLKKVSGINVSGDMGISNRLNVGIRGSYPRRAGNILLLEDGTPIAPAPYLAPEAYYNPPSDRLDGIEIIKGADVLTLGSNTVYGAVNYITKKPPIKPTFGMNITSGANNYNSQFLTYGGTWQNVGAELQVLNKTFGGFQDNSGFSIFNTTAKMYAETGKNSSLYMKINYHQEKAKASYSSMTPYTFQTDFTQNPFDADDLHTRRYAADVMYNVQLGNSIVLSSKLYATQFNRDWWRQENSLVKASGVRAYVGDEIYFDRYNYLEGQTFGNDDWVRVGKIVNGRESTKARNRLFKVVGVQETMKMDWDAGKVHGKLEVGAKAHFESFNNQEIKNDSSRFGRSGVIVLDELYKLASYSGYVKNTFTLGSLAIAPVLRYEIVQMTKVDLLLNSVSPDNSGNEDFGKTTNTFSSLLPGANITYSLHCKTSDITFYSGVYKGYTPPTSGVGFMRVEDEMVNSLPAGETPNMLPESSINAEAGVRFTLWNQTMLGQTTVFRNSITNFYSAGRNEAFQSLGSVTISGLEATLVINADQLWKNKNHRLALTVNGTFMTSTITDGLLSDSDVLKAKHTDATKQELIDKINAEREGYAVYFSGSNGDSLITRELVFADFASIKKLGMIFGADGVAGNSIPYLPPVLLNFSLDYTWKGFNASANYNYVGAQFTDYLNMKNETAEGAMGELPAFSTIDVSLGYSFSSMKSPWLSGMNIFVAGKNLTDEVFAASRLHRVSSGIMPGGFRQVNVGVRWTL